MLLERSTKWWGLLTLRLAVAGGVAVIAHGLTDSYTLALVLLFTVIAALGSPYDSAPERSRTPGPLPIPRHPIVALTCAGIATAAWAITHYALNRSGDEAAPGVTFVALTYIWVLRSDAQEKDRRGAQPATARPRVDPAQEPATEFVGSIAAVVGETFALKSTATSYVLKRGESALGRFAEFGRGEEGLCETADGRWLFANRRGDGLGAYDVITDQKVASYVPAFGGGTIHIGGTQYRLRPPMMGRAWRLRRSLSRRSVLTVEPRGASYELRISDNAADVDQLSLVTMLALAAITWTYLVSPPAPSPGGGM